MSDYLDYSGRDDALSGGARMIPVSTPAGTFRVWTKRIGNNPDLKLLLLHGGPGATHEYLEACDSYLPAAGIEYYYYDQLGSGRSDQPDEPSLWELDRFVDEVERVRHALGLDRDNFVLFGHSWGGILAMEYALRYQEHLRGLVISNMMSSAPAYSTYAEQALMPEMDQTALAEILSLEESGKTEDPRYMELLNEQHYVHHILRMPVDEWPDPVQRAFAHINPSIYVSMQGPSELGISKEAKLADWECTDRLASIDVPTLVIGARYDSMDPAHMEMMAGQLPKGRDLAPTVVTSQCTTTSTSTSLAWSSSCTNSPTNGVDQGASRITRPVPAFWCSTSAADRQSRVALRPRSEGFGRFRIDPVCALWCASAS